MKVLKRPDGSDTTPATPPIEINDLPMQDAVTDIAVVAEAVMIPASEFHAVIDEVTRAVQNEVKQRGHIDFRIDVPAMEEEGGIDLMTMCNVMLQTEEDGWIELFQVSLYNEENGGLQTNVDLIEFFEHMIMAFTINNCFSEDLQELAGNLAGAIEEEDISFSERLNAYENAMQAANTELSPYREAVEPLFAATFVGQMTEASEYLSSEAPWAELKPCLNVLLDNIEEQLEGADENAMLMIMACLSYHMAMKPTLEALKAGAEERCAEDYKLGYQQRVTEIMAQADAVFPNPGDGFPGL